MRAAVEKGALDQRVWRGLRAVGFTPTLLVLGECVEVADLLRDFGQHQSSMTTVAEDPPGLGDPLLLRSGGVADNEGLDTRAATARRASELMHGRWGWMLAFLIGFGPWLIVNGTFTELYALFSRVPECKAISSQLSAAVQFGNVVPFAVVALRNRNLIGLTRTIGVMNLTSLVACLLLALAWDWRTGLPGWPGHHSTGLLLLTLVGGFVGCCSGGRARRSPSAAARA